MGTGTCSVCGGELPSVEMNAPGDPVCPKCASEHFLRKTQRVKVLRVLLEMYGLKEEEVDAATLDRLAKDYYKRLEGQHEDASAQPAQGESSPPLALK